MKLQTWLMKEVPLLREAREGICATLQFWKIRTLDELVVFSRTPVRTALLVLHSLVQECKVRITDKGIEVIGFAPQSIAALQHPFLRLAPKGRSNLINKYVAAASQREQPSLLWGQRRLVPISAVERAIYLVTLARKRQGKILFLGDDDLASPLTAAFLPNWETHVVDIDSEVLGRATSIAIGLGAGLTTCHSEISQYNLESNSQYDIVVSDPFPSGDGSFESVFWRVARERLVKGGYSVTTIAPSHKSINYSDQAIKLKQRLGFSLVDLRADFGCYESFPFEFTDFETRFMSEYGLHSSISHTKSLLTSRRLRELSTFQEPKPDFDFESWTTATASHYLTRQAGLREQQAIANFRGVAESTRGLELEKNRAGFSAELILPESKRAEVVFDPRRESQDWFNSWQLVLTNLGVQATRPVITELMRLATLGGFNSEESLAPIGLAIRAVESWERWRLDQ